MENVPLPHNMLDDETLELLNQALAGSSEPLEELRRRLVDLALVSRMRGGVHLPGAYMTLIALAETHGVSTIAPRELQALFGRAAVEISASAN